MRVRKAGFIKTYSCAQLQPQPSEFSYFKLRNQAEDEEFSPYKFEQGQDQQELKQTLPTRGLKTVPRPPLPHKSLTKAQTVTNIADRIKADHLQERIRRQVRGHEQRQVAKGQQLQENISNIRNKIQKLDDVLKNLQSEKHEDRLGEEVKERVKIYERKMMKKFEEDSQSESGEESSEEQMMAIPQQKVSGGGHESSMEKRRMVVQNEEQSQQQLQEERLQERCSGKLSSTNLNRNSQKYEFQTQNPQQVKYCEQQNVITFNSRLKDRPAIKIKQYSSSSSDHSQPEDEIIGQTKFKATLPQPHQRNMEINQRNRDRQGSDLQKGSTKQFHKNRGGVCFDVDVKQFVAPLPKDDKDKPVQKRKERPQDRRADLLRRRQAAKAYDRMARRVIFSPSH